MSSSPEKERVEGYLGTVDRLEPNLYMVDRDAALASIAISLRRIADVLEGNPEKLGLVQHLAKELGEINVGR